MALLDDGRQVIVIRIVYDGPALSGKTTTLRALAGSLGRDLYSGDEAEGRTLYFDWLDYTGGRFEGFPIRCQIVSVPGQRSLRARRVRLLGTADAVVFVADARRQQLEAGARTLSSLREIVSANAPPVPGIVVQANKRDDPDAVGMEEVRARLGANGSSAVVETVATTGSGVRETFVLAVRLALDRVRELMRRSVLPKGRPDIDSGAALLEALRAAEEQSYVEKEQAVALGGLREAVASEVLDAKPDAPRAEPAIPRLPSASVPGGMIWPPVAGRVLLHEAIAEQASVEPRPDGNWVAASGRWGLLSYAEDCLGDADEARARLIEWARWHSSLGERLSTHRCILASTDAAAWRLWQVVRRERTLRTALETLLSGSDPETIARGCFDLGRAYAHASDACAAGGLRCSVDEIGMSESGWFYVGFAPRLATLDPSSTRPRRSVEDTLRAELGPVIARRMTSSSLDVPRVLHYLTPLATSVGQPRMGEVLAAMLIGH